eukprot:Pgem_evm1s709
MLSKSLFVSLSLISLGTCCKSKSKPTNCNNDAYLECIDFENEEQLMQRKDITFGSDAKIVRDSDKMSGSNSLYFNTIKNSTNFHSGYMKLNSPNGTHWGRSYLKIKKVDEGFVHTSFVAVKPPGTSPETRFVDTVKGKAEWFNGIEKIQLLYNYDDDLGGYSTEYEHTDIANGNWACVEWHVDWATQSFEFFLNNTKIDAISKSLDLTNFDRPIPKDKYEWIAFGAQSYQSDIGVEGFIDDIVLSTEK